MAAEACYHCGLDVPQPTTLYVRVDGQPRAMCCIGCQAVAQAIVDNHLEDYYRHRDALPESPREALPAPLQELALFDQPAFQQGFVRTAGEHEREADLILEGITCAACVWLNERHLGQLPGITAVQVNYTTRRARVRWDAARLKLSDILGAVAAIGYRAHPFDPALSEQVAQRERRSALWRLFVAGFGMMQVMMYAYPVYIAGEGDMTPAVESLMRWASLILTLPVVLYSAAPFFQRAWRDLRLRRLGMDVPVALGVGSAFLASMWGTLTGRGEVYFDSVTMFVFFLLGGRYLEMLARQRATRGAETIARVIPAYGRRIVDGHDEQVPVSALAAGDLLRVLPGETIVADGVVEDGTSEVDESWLTGESRPLPKALGAMVLAGSINTASPLVFRAQSVGEATRLSALRRLVEQAASERPRIVEQADRIAGRFVAVLLVLAVITGAYWWQVSPEHAFWICVSVLVVSCPCALSLATPVALTVATDAFGRAGLLVTRAHAIETLARADHIVFDKTGTLTLGRMRLREVLCAPGQDAARATAIAAALERHSEHAIARALVDASALRLSASEVHAQAGQGIAGQVDGVACAIGRRAFVAACAHDAMPAEWGTLSGSEVFLVVAGQWCAAFVVDDLVRPDAAATIAALQARGLRVSIFSGDAPSAVAPVAAALGVSDARAGMSPEDKHAALRALQAEGRVIAMVGDGVNDGPVLAQAHVSIAMGGGTDLARSQGDMLLLNDVLGRIVTARDLSRRTLSIVRQNLAWAFAYNILSVPAAMMGWVTPWIAGIGMGSSSLLVVLNALRLGRGRVDGARRGQGRGALPGT
ncbi:MAG: heavy metal translocating P-type ATPase [Rhodocyclaceae bacterium]